jgi:hypothetical protein
MIPFILFALLIIAILKGYTTITIFSAIAIIVYIAVRINNRRKSTQNDGIQHTCHRVETKNIDDDGAYFTRIAGAQYRCGKQDVGGFLGYVCPEPKNKYDKNAIAIYRNDKKLLGYIPKDEQSDFREWSDKKLLHCVGFLKEGEEVPIFGRVKVVDGDDEENYLIVLKFVRWLVVNFGKEFIPKGFNLGAAESLEGNELVEYMDKEIAKLDDEEEF